MHVVIVDEELPYPMNSGKRLRTMQLVSRLAKRHEITYICHRNKEVSEIQPALDYFKQLGVETIVVEQTLRLALGPVAFYTELVTNLGYMWPFSVQRHSSRAIQQAIRLVSEQKPVDLWHCEWTPYAHSIATLKKPVNINSVVSAPVVVMAHNIESLIWERYHSTEKNIFKKWYIGEQLRKYRNFEKHTFAETDCLITVSEPDAVLARKEFGATTVSVVDNGVDIEYYANPGHAGKPDKLLFLGSLDWRPNQQGLRRLLESVFPKVIKAVPTAELCIVGRNPPAWLEKMVSTIPSVELYGDVPDVRTYIAACGLMVVPLEIGGGSRLKILEAAASNLPVVSTRVGAEGLRLKPDTHFVEVPDVDGIAQAVITCIQNNQASKEMAVRARKIVEDEYGWDAQANLLDTVWRQFSGGYADAP